MTDQADEMARLLAIEAAYSALVHRAHDTNDDHLIDAIARANRETATEQAVLPAPVALTAAERQFLGFALDLVFDRMVSEDGFTDEDRAALDKFRHMADEAQEPEEAGR